MFAIAGFLRQHQRAAKLRWRATLGVALPERDSNPLGRDAGRLLGHAGHGAPFGGEEIDIAYHVGFQALGLDDQRRIARFGDAEPRRPRALHRHDAARLVEQRARCAIGRLGRRSDRQGQGELAFFRNADVVTDQPVGAGRERQCASREIGRRRDLHQQQDVVLEAVVGHAADIDQRRSRPDNGIGLHAGRQGPADLGRQARIAGVLPVGVPMRPDGLAQRHPERLAGFDLRHFGDQLGAHVVGLHHRLCDSGPGRKQQDQKGKQAAHGCALSDLARTFWQAHPDQPSVINMIVV